MNFKNLSNFDASIFHYKDIISSNKLPVEVDCALTIGLSIGSEPIMEEIHWIKLTEKLLKILEQLFIETH